MASRFTFADGDAFPEGDGQTAARCRDNGAIPSLEAEMNTGRGHNRYDGRSGQTGEAEHTVVNRPERTARTIHGDADRAACGELGQQGAESGTALLPCRSSHKTVAPGCEGTDQDFSIITSTDQQDRTVRGHTDDRRNHVPMQTREDRGWTRLGGLPPFDTHR